MAARALILVLSSALFNRVVEAVLALCNGAQSMGLGS